MLKQFNKFVHVYCLRYFKNFYSLLPIRNQSESPQSIRAAFTALRKAKKTDTDMQSGGSPVAKNKKIL